MELREVPEPNAADILPPRPPTDPSQGGEVCTAARIGEVAAPAAPTSARKT